MRSLVAILALASSQIQASEIALGDSEKGPIVHTLKLAYNETGPYYSALMQFGSKSLLYFLEVNLDFDNLIITGEGCQTSSKAPCQSK